MLFSLIAFGFFVTSLGLLQWKPGSSVARWVHMGFSLLLFGACLIWIVFALFTFFWPPAKVWALVWSAATLVVLFFVAASNPAPSWSEWLS